MNLEIEKAKSMTDKAQDAASFLKGLANPQRLLILCELAQGEKSVSELMTATNIPQTSMSQHLAKLKAEGIADYRRDHRTLYYSISSPHALGIMGVLYEAFCKPEDEKDG